MGVGYEFGVVFGDVGLFLGRPAPVDAVVLEDAQLLRLGGPDLVRLVSSRPRVALRWMVSMATRLADTQDRLEEFAAVNAGDHALSTGAKVVVVGVVSGNTLRVEPFPEPAEVKA